MAQFRIDQVGPGAGIPGRSRHDLVAGAVISFVATAPVGPGCTYQWELLDVVGGLGHIVGSTTASTITVGEAGDIVPLSAYRMQLTAFDGVNTTKIIRICSVRGTYSALRPLVFSESAPPTGTLSSNTPDASEDNALYPNRAGRGLSEQNWRDWAEWGWEITSKVESLSAGAGAFPAILSGTGAWSVPFASVVGGLLYPTGSFSAGTADNGAIGTAPVFGIITAKPTATTATVAYVGELSGFVGLTPGANYYLGTGGALTTTPPNTPGSGKVVQRVGVALSATKLLFRPYQEIVL